MPGFLTQSHSLLQLLKAQLWFLRRYSTLGAADFFSGGGKVELGAGLLLVVADDAGFAGYPAEGMFSRLLGVLWLEAMAGLALDIGIFPDIGGIEESLPIAERMATDTVVAALVAGFFELVKSV